MANPIADVLRRIAEEHRGRIQADSRFYREVGIGDAAARLGGADLGDAYAGVFAIVPLKRPEPGMTVRIDGRTFVGYAQFASGVVVPGYVARAAGLPFTAYVPNDSMLLNFA